MDYMGKAEDMAPKLYEQLMRHEGKNIRNGLHVTYKCPSGALTIGYGHNLDANPIVGLSAGSMIEEARAREILSADVAACAGDLDKKIPWWRSLNFPRQAVLLNMCFNMGTRGLMQFRGTLAAIQRKDWAGARTHMLNSKWAKQVGRRARELASQMFTGTWAEAEK